MTKRLALPPLVLWSISIPTLTWSLLGGPSIAKVVAYATFGAGLLSFFWWANTGGWPAAHFLR